MVSFFAAHASAMSCEARAEKAAKAIAELNGSSKKLAEATTSLSNKARDGLTYETMITYQSSDGASTVEFPSETYQIKTKGTEASCSIEQVTVQ